MNTHVIILCQGEQKRLPDLAVPKQLLMLWHCNNVSILRRTIDQVHRLLATHVTLTTIVGKREPFATVADVVDRSSRGVVVNTELDDPGNSSLKGIARYLAEYRGQISYPRTVVLLGDVVYSWACLETLLAPYNDRYPTYRFVGTHNLSPSGGELWGLSWNRDVDDFMRQRLGAAVATHPPFTDYQPGQLRRWLWMMPFAMTPPSLDKPPSLESKTRAYIDLGTYVPVDDYTRDIDLPEHISRLDSLSVLAAADDKEHGLVW